MTPAPIAYRHPSLGFTLELPAGAEVLPDVPGAALVAAEPLHEQVAFRANLVVTVEEGQPSWDSLEAYTDASLATQAEVLIAFRLIDRAAATLRGGEAARTLGHHDVDGQAVTIEQWRLLSAGRGYTLTGSCWTLDYDSLTDAFTTSAETFVP